tara:strand:- start:7 stop:162 length:156 start_codon:yes stop_codon:yes gene_type:complete
MQEIKAKLDEQHKLMMRIMEVMEYGNIDDLKKINKLLVDNRLGKEDNDDKM